MEVSVHELKAELSAYFERAAAGDQITVTHRGKPIAALGPVLPEGGWMTPASAAGLRAVRRHRSLSNVEQVLAEDRAE